MDEEVCWTECWTERLFAGENQDEPEKQVGMLEERPALNETAHVLTRYFQVIMTHRFIT